MEAPVAEIRPNVNKAFILNILFVLGIVVGIIVLLAYINSLVGLGVFLDILKEFGVDFSPMALLGYGIGSILLFTGLLLILNYLSLNKAYYTLYRDKIVYSRSLFIIQISEQAIPYANIAKISYERKPFLNTSKIILDLTGMKPDKLKMDFIDNAEEVVGKLHGLIREFRANYYARYAQDYRMQNIMDKL